ncbi:MAG: phospholipid carrier-dependent glycosyltransferase, partial [Caldilineae bacterium]
MYALLALVILAGLTLRTWNVRFDSGLGSHPDERSTTCFYAPSIKWPASWDEFKDPHRSPLNPLWDREHNQRRSYTYGHFPLYLGILAGEALHRLAPVGDALGLPEQRVQMMRAANTACDGIAVAGRLLIALLDTLTILLLFFLGRRLYGSGAGLLGASFYAFTAQAIQLSHFFAMDPASTTFTVLAVLGGVRMVQERTWRGVILAGVGAGLAISSKFSALPILAAPVVAALVVAWQSTRPQTGVDSRAALRMIWGAVVALLLAAATFALTSPYAVLDWQSFIQATLVEQGQMVRGIADFPFTRQYRNTTPYLYFIQQQVAWGMWWPLGLVTLAGTLWALVKVFLGRASGGELVVWSWLVPYFGLTGAFLAKFNRYMSPVLPFAVLFAAGFITWLWQVAGGRWQMAGGRRQSTSQPVNQSPVSNLQSPNLQSSIFNLQ